MLNRQKIVEINGFIGGIVYTGVNKFCKSQRQVQQQTNWNESWSRRFECLALVKHNQIDYDKQNYYNTKKNLESNVVIRHRFLIYKY